MTIIKAQERGVFSVCPSWKAGLCCQQPKMRDGKSAYIRIYTYSHIYIHQNKNTPGQNHISEQHYREKPQNSFKNSLQQRKHL